MKAFEIMKFCVLVGMLLIAACSGISCGMDSNNSITLHAEVLYNGGGFTIENNDSFNWENTKYYLNFEGDNLTSGYTIINPIYHSEVYAHYAVSIVDTEFEDAEGHQFHGTLPLEAPFILLIQAETRDGRTGTYLKTWENPDNP